MPKNDLPLATPLMNAAGSLGFAPDPRVGIDLARLGLFITNPVSLKPRAPAHGERFLSYPGGFLLHTGYPNPGFREVLKRHAVHWARSPLPVVVHLLAEAPEELYRMARQLEVLEGVVGIEVGLPPETDAAQVFGFLRAAGGELPVIARLPFERALELAGAIAALPRLGEAGVPEVVALSLAPPRGALPAEDGRLVGGRLYGPAVFPAALALVQQLTRYGLPVFAAGGVYSQPSARAMLSAGAAGVQLDAALWCLPRVSP